MYHFFLLRDIIEIIFYSSIVYCFCLWLKTDKTKNLLIYFLAYCTFTLCSWALQLPTITALLLSYAPIALLLFIIFHEKTLQRNFVTLSAITPAKKHDKDWIDLLLSSSLSIINNNKNISVIIENKQSLEHFLSIPFFINADINKEVLDIFLSSTSYDEKKMVLLNSNGLLRSFNVSWNDTNTAIFYTMHTDSIICNAYHLSRTFTLIINGTETTNLSAQHARIMLKKQLSITFAKQHKGTYHENTPVEKHIS